MSWPRRLASTKITDNTLHPGLVVSNFGSGQGWLSWGISLVTRLAGINVTEGAQTSIYLATSPRSKGLRAVFQQETRDTLGRGFL